MVPSTLAMAGRIPRTSSVTPSLGAEGETSGVVATESPKGPHVQERDKDSSYSGSISRQCSESVQDNWEAITEDPVTLDAVTGFTIPFATTPPCRLPTQEELTAVDSDPVVDESIKEILDLKAAVIVPPDTPGFYSRVFTAVSLQFQRWSKE